MMMVACTAARMVDYGGIHQSSFRSFVCSCKLNFTRINFQQMLHSSDPRRMNQMNERQNERKGFEKHYSDD